MSRLRMQQSAQLAKSEPIGVQTKNAQAFEKIGVRMLQRERYFDPVQLGGVEGLQVFRTYAPQ